MKHRAEGAPPAWLNRAGRRVDSRYEMSVHSGPFVTEPECRGALVQRTREAADEYVEQFLGVGTAALVKLDAESIRRWVQDEYIEQRQTSVGPMLDVHQLMIFDTAARAEMERRWHDATVAVRLKYIGAGSLLVLALLGTLYGYLRLDRKVGARDRY